jgi:uncharacterized protein (TIGR03084 family)
MMEIFDDLQAEQEQLDAVLAELPPEAWNSASAAEGWTIADVVLHLAQTEEAVAATAAGVPLAWREYGGDVESAMSAMVNAQRDDTPSLLPRWRTARAAAMTALRQADPGQHLPWVHTAVRPAALATTRLAEHWAHALDIVTPLGIDYPDTARLRHVAWLAHRTLPYALQLEGLPVHDLYCELMSPDGAVWRYGPPEAASSITGPAAAFCRVAAKRLAPGESGLITHGPQAVTALRVIRTYAA